MKEIYNRNSASGWFHTRRKSWRYSLALLFGMFWSISSFGQVSEYIFSQSTGTYTPITGGTSIIACIQCSASYDADSYVVTLPSSFSFNGSNISSVVMRVDGSLVLGSISTSSATSPISASTVANGVIAGLGMDLRSSSMSDIEYELRWEDVGSEYVFQWKNASRWSQQATERFNFQIRIVKSTGVIKIVYGDFITIANSTTYQPQVGLRGLTNSDYNARRLTNTVPDNSPSWDDTLAAVSNSNTVRFTSGSPVAFPFAGLIYTWTPPVVSTVPNCATATTSTPSNNATGVTSKAFTWSAGSGGVAGYKLYVGTDEEASNVIDGLDVGAVLTYTVTELVYEPLTDYYWRAVPYNEFGEAMGCTVRKFTTANVPNCATLTAPANEATNTAKNPTLTWT
ncbi:MAG: hypothetical protein EOO43_20700, partial [Flavobacterium sp.]